MFSSTSLSQRLSSPGKGSIKSGPYSAEGCKLSFSSLFSVPLSSSSISPSSPLNLSWAHLGLVLDFRNMNQPHPRGKAPRPGLGSSTCRCPQLPGRHASNISCSWVCILDPILLPGFSFENHCCCCYCYQNSFLCPILSLLHEIAVGIKAATGTETHMSSRMSLAFC